MILAAFCLSSLDIASRKYRFPVRRLELKDFIGVRYTRYGNTDPSVAFLIYTRLRAVGLHTFLQLVDCIPHIFIRRVLLLRLIGDTDPAGQIQAKFDIFHSPTVGSAPSETHCIGQECYHQNRPKKSCDPSAFLHILHPLLFKPAGSLPRCPPKQLLS